MHVIALYIANSSLYEQTFYFFFFLKKDRMSVQSFPPHFLATGSVLLQFDTASSCQVVSAGRGPSKRKKLREGCMNSQMKAK